MVELLIVVAVIGILAGALLVAGSAVIDNAKATKTQFMLGIVRDAVEQFRMEQTDRPTLTKSIAYQKRYGVYPPDELEVFTALGVPYGNALYSRAVGKHEVMPGPANNVLFGNMTFQVDGLDPAAQSLEHRDLAALTLSIGMFSDAGSAMLEKIPASHWRTPVDPADTPLQFLNRDDNENYDAGVDQEIRHLLDDWGVPITYFSQRDAEPGQPTDPTLSSNGTDWNAASSAMVRINAGQPILCSYGPDGAEQLSKETLAAATAALGAPPATLEADWASDTDGKIDSPLNADNVYPDDALKAKLARGVR